MELLWEEQFLSLQELLGEFLQPMLCRSKQIIAVVLRALTYEYTQLIAEQAFRVA